jgi:hypothetical protein
MEVSMDEINLHAVIVKNQTEGESRATGSDDGSGSEDDGAGTSMGGEGVEDPSHLKISCFAIFSLIASICPLFSIFDVFQALLLIVDSIFNYFIQV